MFFKKVSHNTKRNKLITQNIQNLHSNAVKYAKKLEKAYQDKKRIQVYLSQLTVENDKNQQESSSKENYTQKELKALKKELEKITKNFNSVSSQNAKKRHEISSLRKERTLYDHLFKTLEYQILNEEKNIISLIQQNEQEEAQINKHNENLKGIKELVKKNKYEDFYKIIEQEKQKYLTEVTEPYRLKNEKQRHTQFNKKSQKMSSFKIQFTQPDQNDFKEINKPLIIEDSDDDENQKQIKQLFLMEQVKAEFNYYTENEDLNFIHDFLNNGEQINTEMYSRFCEYEDRLKNLNQENKELEQQIFLLENPNIIIEKKNNQKEEDLNRQFEEEFQKQMLKLQKVLVSQKLILNKNLEVSKSENQDFCQNINFEDLSPKQILQQVKKIENQISETQLKNYVADKDTNLLQQIQENITKEEKQETKSKEQTDQETKKDIFNISQIAQIITKMQFGDRKDELLITQLPKIKQITIKEIKNCLNNKKLKTTKYNQSLH